MENEFCHNCNLKLCGTDQNPDCEFSVHIRGNAKYFILLYGVTDKVRRCRLPLSNPR